MRYQPIRLFISIVFTFLILFVPGISFAQGEGLAGALEALVSLFRIVLLVTSGLVSIIFTFKIVANRNQNKKVKKSFVFLLLISIFLFCSGIYPKPWLPEWYPQFKRQGDFSENMRWGRYWIEAPIFFSSFLYHPTKQDALKVARDYLKEAMRQAPNRLEPYLGMIQSFDEEGNSEKKDKYIKSIRNHISWSTEDFLQYVNYEYPYGSFDLNPRRLDGVYEFALSVKPDDLTVMEILADHYFELAERAQSSTQILIEINNKIINKFPQSLKATSDLILFAHDQNQTGLYEEIKKIEGNIVEKSDTDYFYLGQAHFIMGNWAEAEKNWRMIKDPKFEVIIIQYWLGAIDIAKGDITKALEDFPKRYEGNRETYYHHFHVRESQFDAFKKWGLTQEDIAWVGRDNTNDNEQPEVFFLKRAKLLFKLHRCQEAIPDINHVLNSDEKTWAWIRDDAKDLMEQCRPVS